MVLRKDRPLLAAFVVWCTVFPLVTFVFCAAIPGFAFRYSPALPGALARPPATAGSPVLDTLASKRLEASFRQSVCAMAGDDSVDMVLDAPAERLCLVIRGCTVRQCPLLGFRTCVAAEALRRGQGLSALASSPLVKRREFATIVKIPSRVKRVPKDTVAAAAASDMPAPFEKCDVNCVMYFGDSLQLDIRQIEQPSIRYALRRIVFETRKALQTAHDAAAALARGSLPRFRLRLAVTLSRDDATAVYRATAAHCRLALQP
jgi:hypothetical protein